MVSVMTLLRDPSRTSGASDPFLCPLELSTNMDASPLLSLTVEPVELNLLYALANSRRSAEITGAATAARG